MFWISVGCFWLRSAIAVPRGPIQAILSSTLTSNGSLRGVWGPHFRVRPTAQAWGPPRLSRSRYWIRTHPLGLPGACCGFTPGNPNQCSSSGTGMPVPPDTWHAPAPYSWRFQSSCGGGRGGAGRGGPPPVGAPPFCKLSILGLHPWEKTRTCHQNHLPPTSFFWGVFFWSGHGYLVRHFPIRMHPPPGPFGRK